MKLKPNQLVQRIKGGENCFPSVGARAFVSTVGTDSITLEGYGDVPFLPEHFSPVDDREMVAKGKPEVHQLIEALEVVDKWNKVCPTGLLVSIEGHEAVNGGSVFDVGGRIDTNNPQELFETLMGEATAIDFKKQLAQLNTLAGLMS